MNRRMVTAAGLAVSLATMAVAQPVIDGRISGDEALYGAAKWIQTVPTGFGDNRPDLQPPCNPLGDRITIALDNSNTAGVTGSSADGAEFVTSGIEVRIPFSQLGNPTGPIKVAGFINGGGHDFLSNQVIGGLPIGSGNLGEPRSVNFTLIDGTQYVVVGNPAVAPTVGAVMDGVLGNDPYGSLLFIQQNPTQFGDATNGQQNIAIGGSEINGVYAYVFEAEIDGRPLERYLQILITGNLESNFNKLDLFFDTGEGGQNRLRGDNPDIDFNGLNRMGDDGSGNGLTFDADFTANYFLTFTNGPTDPASWATYANFAEVRTEGGGTGNFLGSGGAGTDALVADAPCPPTVPDVAFAIGSELNSLYSYVDSENNRLYLLITGNLSSVTGDTLVLFFDSNGNPTGDEGQNTIRDNNVVLGIADGTGGAIRRLGFDGVDPGLTFDADFFADYYMAFHYESLPIRNVLDAAVLRTGGAQVNAIGNPLDYGSFAGVNVPGVIPFDGTNFTDFTTSVGIQFQDGFLGSIYAAYPPREARRVLDAAYAAGIFDIPSWEAFVPTVAQGGLILAAGDNSNIGGVTDTSAAGAALATTGIEISIDLDELGWDGESEIKVAGFIINGSFTFVSNQVLGDAPGASNLGEPRLVNFSTVPGTQYVVVTGDAPVTDCNQNGIPDAQEIAANPALDCFNPAVVQNPNVIGGPDGIIDACQCAADWNRDGQVNSNDISAYLSSWLASVGAGTTGADINCSGSVNSNDISAFLGLWLAAVQNTIPYDGCP